jgi:hypothetical protein
MEDLHLEYFLVVMKFSHVQDFLDCIVDWLVENRRALTKTTYGVHRGLSKKNTAMEFEGD